MGNVVSLMRQRCIETPNAPFIKRSGESEYMNYGDFRIQARRVLKHVLDNCADETRVCLLAENSPMFAVGLFGLWGAGKTVIPVDIKLTPEEIGRIVQDSGATVFYVSRMVAEKFAGGAAALGIRAHVLEEVVQGSEEANMVELADDQTAVMIYSSGTTGDSKGICLSHHNLFHNTTSCSKVLEVTEADNFLALLPLNHAFALTTMLLLPIPTGAKITTIVGINPAEILRSFKQDGITVATVVPRLVRLLAQALNRKALAELPPAARGPALLGDQLRLLVSGGAPLSPAIEGALVQAGVNLVQGYGLSENSPVVCVNPPHDSRIGTVGRAMEGITLRIHEPNNNGEGELVVRGDSVMQGYHNRPEETAEAIRNGELFTGDVARVDDNGYVTICGRIKNVIIADNGKNVYPEEIESELLKSPLINDAAVVGVHREVKGTTTEEIVAAVTLLPEAVSAALGADVQKIDLSDPGMQKLAAETVSQACASLADYKRVTRTVVMETLPTTASGKVRVVALRPMLQK